MIAKSLPVTLIYQVLILKMVFPSYEWGESCHEDCQCYVTSLSQTSISNCLRGQGHRRIKAIFCVIQNETNLITMFYSLPNDTQVLTLLQSADTNHVTITHQVMANLTNLIGIDIQGSNFKKKKMKISSNALKEAKRLQYVSMQNVKWDSQKQLLTNISSLQCVQIISCNTGDIVKPMFDGMKQLRELYLIQSGIKSLGPEVFQDTAKLQKLSLSNNKISELYSSSLEGLHSLEILDLTYNQLESISSVTFPFLWKLQWLELKDNPIKAIFPNAFWGFNSTRRISFGHKTETTFITRLAFNGLASLKLLRIPNIDIDMINENIFTGLRSLLHLELNGRVKAIGKNAFLGSHIHLDKIIIHNCKLEYIHDEAFSELSKLKSLDLSFNHLEELPKDVFLPLVSLLELILSQNKLKTLPELIFHPLVSLQTLRLDANPWNCTCTMSNWNEELTSRTRQFSPVICSLSQPETCNTYQSKLVFDSSVIPVCEYPLEWQGETVFNVVSNRLFCDILLLRD